MAELRTIAGRPLRCAIYTRKSSEEGLEQDFNSLDAQREACEAYIASQRHEGWKLLPKRYDDGGFSGGTMVRPALKRLLDDIQAGQIDVVVVYKVDRLTRSLADFAKIVETFDAKGVSFVSVTQSFNTTSSMGRLTLNVLLSFAQFEREVTGERIRDKIAASKKKGLWMGGFVPMGYTADGRTLKIVGEDAAIIRDIFERFLELGSVRLLKDELDRKGVVSRAFVSGAGREWGDRYFGLGHLRKILNMAIYVGEISHKGQRYPGQHPAIVSRELFDAVQQRLGETGGTGAGTTKARNAHLLAGLLVEAKGNPLIGSHAIKNGRRYRYYVTRPGITPALRIPTSELEPLILDTVIERLKDRTWLLNSLSTENATPKAIQAVITKADSMVADLRENGLAEQIVILRGLIERIIIDAGSISIMLKPDPLKLEDREYMLADPVTIDLDVTLKPRGRELCLVLEGDQNKSPEIDKPMLKAIARGVTWYQELASGEVASMEEIAAREGLTARYVGRTIRLGFLAPDLVAGCLDGTRQLPLTTVDISMAVELPPDWREQRVMCRG